MKTFESLIRRATLSAAVIISLLIPGLAKADAWDGITVAESFAIGDGSIENPYQIQSAAEFMLLVHDQSLWTKHFIQVVDIDLEGITLPNSIGGGDYASGANSYDSAYSGYRPFKGTYNGNGHKLSNFKMLWDTATSTCRTFGLFGYFTGELRNLHVDNATLTRTLAGSVKSDPVKMGIVIAAISPQRLDTDNGTDVYVENIIVTNSKITDNGKAFATNGMYIGGVIGDIASGMTGYQHINASWSHIIIRNIYADIDIDLPKGKNESTTYCQYNVGGVFGRQRRGRYCDLPDNIYFTGTIQAPGATVAPTIGFVRNNGEDTYESTTSAYIGEYMTEYAENLTAVTNSQTDYPTYYRRMAEGDTFQYHGATVTPGIHRYYGDYTIKYTGGETTVTDTYPAADESRTYGHYLRTIANTGNFTRSEADMLSFQGVGLATYAPDFLDAKPVFDSYITSRGGVLKDIVFSDGAPHFTNDAYITAERINYDSVDYTILQGSSTADYTITWTAYGKPGTPNLSGTVQHASITGAISIPNALNYTHAILSLSYPGGATTQFALSLYLTSTEIRRVGGYDFSIEYTNIFPDLIDQSRYTFTLTGITRGETPAEITVATFSNAPATYTYAKPDMFRELRLTTAIDGTPVNTSTVDIYMLPHFIMSQPDMNTIRAELPLPFDDLDYIYRWQGFNGFDWEWFTPVAQSDVDGVSTITVANDDGYFYYRVYVYIDNDTPLTFLNGDEFFGEIVHHTDLWYDYDLEIDSTVTPGGNLRYTARVINKATGVTVMGGPENIQMAGYGWLWNVSSDPTSRRSWEGVNFATLDHEYIEPWSPERFYRVSLVRLLDDGHGHTTYEVLKERVRGPINVVFVYDKAKTAQGRSRGVTTFDGMDRWIDEDNVTHEEEFPDGDDFETGYGPYHAVNTMRRAYELLETDKGIDGNLIVVMGYYYDTNFMHITEEAKGTYAKPCEITGRRGALVYDGAINMSLYDGSDDTPIVLEAATKFTEITFVGYKILTHDPNNNKIVYTKAVLDGTPTSGTIYCNLHDLTIGDNVKVKRYAAMPTAVGGSSYAYGLLDDSKAPYFTIVGGIHNYHGTVLPDRPNNSEPNITTITINSGCFGRIIAGARNNAATKGESVFGSPEKPHRVKVNISITHMTADGNEFHPDDNYDYDIGLLTGGQTDGSIFAETVLYMNSGTVGRFISGSISFGRRLKDIKDKFGNVKYNIPADSYFGSTVLTLQGGSIRELYGGSLGRMSKSSTATQCEAYFYGRSVININGGVVGYPKTFVADDPSTWGNIYTAGAGGVTGLGDDVNHTSDSHIPYYAIDGDPEVWYGVYEDIAEKFPGDNQVATRMPSIDLIMEDNPERRHLDLSDSYCELYLTAGTIYGSVYGGGYGYSSQIPVQYAIPQAGNLYGHTRVVVNGSRSESVTIKGNVYGGGAGSDGYYRAAEGNKDRFARVGRLYGDTHIDISTGTIEGNVYGGAQGIEGFEEMGTVFGNTNLKIYGYPTIYGNIFGGSAMTGVYRRQQTIDGPWVGGSVSIDISEFPTIGNNIFGGCEGRPDERDDDGNIVVAGTNTRIEGSVDMTITGGSFLPDPYIRKVVDGVETRTPRTFNIYGGGYLNCDIEGSVKMLITKALLDDEASIMPATDNINSPATYKNNFDAAFRDITFRRFCVYGGGFGEQTRIYHDTDVTVDIPTDVAGYVIPSSANTEDLDPGQTFFDIAGGGYAGSIGRWMPNADGTDLYDHYEGGNTTLTIKGYTFLRKAIGGGFYGSTNVSTMNIISGNIGNVQGGALLGYVHDHVQLRLGSRPEDFPGEPELAAFYNRHLFVMDNVYGGNDVKGIVGTKKWVGTMGESGSEGADGGPLFMADVSDEDGRGVNMEIFGGTYNGNIYGGGNGHYRGYYVPEWTRYNDGPARHYRKVRSQFSPTGYGYAYRNRPMVGSVKVNIRGNSEDDPIRIKGNFFGGGRSCTIGQWNTILPFEDPRRLSIGGFLHVNFGGYTTIEGNAYMGSQGEYFDSQPIVPDGIDVHNFNGSALANLERMGEAAYGHWYWSTADGCYLPGYPKDNDFAGNYGMTGEHIFRGFMKNVEMQGDVEVTFYRDIYDGDGNRRRWLPIENAVNDYDAPGITMNSFFLGGQVGSMTNNTVMGYKYPASKPGEEEEEEEEEFASIYRFTLPRRVVILNKVVAGSENASSKYYDYKPGYHELQLTDDEGNDAPIYTFDGGMVTQTIFTYDLVVWNDRNYEANNGRIFRMADIDDYHLDPSDPDYYQHTLVNFNPGTTIYRSNYDRNHPTIPNAAMLHPVYAIAVLSDNPEFEADGSLKHSAIKNGYVGPRDSRPHTTVVKGAVTCTFDPQHYEDAADPDDHFSHFGGNVYGGCYNSGITTGDVILLVSANMLGSHAEHMSDDIFGAISSLKYNIGRVYGGGYGRETVIEGDTYINLLRNFVGMNVFGGGMEGSVTGKATINYVGTEDQSFVYGAIYGGSLRGNVGTPDVTMEGTEINLISGNVDRVYGGSCMGNIYGSTTVNAFDEVFGDLPHFDYSRLVDYSTFNGWSGSRLIVGHLFGGNDISGNIVLPASADPEQTYHTNINVYEYQDKDPSHARPARYREETVDSPEEEGPGKTSPGSDNGYNGFPLIGNLFGGSNGNYGKHENTQYYTEGTIEIASNETSIHTVIDLANNPETGTAFEVPHIERTRIRLQGGTVINAYGGGDMSTITEKVNILVAYGDGNDKARAGFVNQSERDRIWNVCHLSNDQQIDEVISETDDGYVFDQQIFRLFGGNNRADMNIQPTWDLRHGHIGSIYSGGNFGRMTYFERIPVLDNNGEPTGEYTPQGLSLTIDSPTIYAKAVYGGGRIGDIAPFIGLPRSARAKAEGENFEDIVDTEVSENYAPAADGESEPDPYDPSLDNFYGATLTIIDGVINEVYGGNDVAGDVYYGTNVNIHGAISGNVYCAGNGNHYYQYRPDFAPDASVQETYDDELGRYFLLPQIPDYGGDNPSDAQKVLAINAWRPNVSKSLLHIAGSSADHIAHVSGSVFCGGNSATVDPNLADPGSVNVIKFQIGDNVILNNVFLGSNGESLVNGTRMANTELLNNITLAQANNFSAEDVAALTGTYAIDDTDAADIDLYPYVLDLYMRAVDVKAKPHEFDFPNDLQNAYIGSFYVGGNCGSMMTDETIHLTFPESLIIYDKIVGGSRSANKTYNGVTNLGGLPKRLAHPEVNPNKVELVVKSHFEPWRLESTRNDYGYVEHVELVPNIEILEAPEQPEDVLADPTLPRVTKPYFPDRLCEIFGGCYNSGITTGGISIDLYSDMVGDYDPASDIAGKINALIPGFDKKQMIINSIDDYSWRAFSVAGGGYGELTRVEGDIRIRMLPGQVSDTPLQNLNPSVATLFGGSSRGIVVGNTTVEVRDGLVLANLYGGSEASPLYGSTQLILGWPRYYVCETPGTATLSRTDNISRAVVDPEFVNADGTPVIRKVVTHRKGDIISCNVYNIMDAADQARFRLVDDDTPANYKVGDSYPLKWDDIDISIGDSQSRFSESAPFYRHGNIYGGGFVSATATAALAGKNTVCRFDKDNNLGPDTYNNTDRTRSAGGNSTIIIWDNYENADPEKRISQADADDGSLIRDHIVIGTARHARAENVTVGTDLMGMYMLDENPSSPTYGRYIHQSPYVIGSGLDEHGNRLGNADPKLNAKYYRIESDGGVYGGGRKVYVENFRDCDIAYYGYADYCPQFPKLINSAQRMDLLTLTDCCLQFQGANDFANNSIDATSYSLTRIGELQLISSIPDDQVLDPGRRESEGLFNIIHMTPRSRNYIAFFNSVRYVSAITSSQQFDSPYRGANGRFYEVGDFTKNGTLRPVADAATPTGCTYTALDSEAGFSYADYKQNRIDNRYRNRAALADLDDSLSEMKSFKVKTDLEFDQRNVGTSPNMIGINNGYVLRVQGARVDAADNDHVYYGPITGVCEIKLLTLAKDEGGGYIFALNKHADGDNQTFLETTGNFIFPGAAYRVNDVEGEEYNYIYDDCFPMGQGYDYYYDHADNHDVDNYLNNHGGQEVHYWYVNGTNFYYNVTLTGYNYAGPQDFHLDNSDNLIYLYGVQPSTSKFRVEEIHWEPFDDGFDHDLPKYGSTDAEYDLDYQLFMSVDKHAEQTHTRTEHADNAFVAAIPRADYSKGSHSVDTVADPAAVDSDNNLVNVINNYSDYSATDQNMPLLGITLLDNVDNSGKEYYEEHLKEDAHVRLVIKACEVDEHGNDIGTTFTYTVNLTIKYLLGPTIKGMPRIENCALPGEYIFANSFDVTVELDDENMAVNERNWYLVAPEHELNDNQQIQEIVDWVKSPVEGVHYVAECINDQKFDNDHQVHIPAYLYRNGWHLVYEIVANHNSFFLHPDSQYDDEHHPEHEHDDHLVVHNYHRMRPYDGSSLKVDANNVPILDADGNTQPRYEDLQIIAGSRLYIEDDNDMAYFLEWLKSCQDESERHTPRGWQIDPQYGAGVDIYLMSDVKMPELTPQENAEAANIIFEGTFRGNGHTVEMGKNTLLLGINRGRIYNTGFVSEMNTSDYVSVLQPDDAGEPCFIYKNQGLVEDCFYYNPKNINFGNLVHWNDHNPVTNQDGQVVNCFQTSQPLMDIPGLRQATLEDFNYGRVAFNLNRFYLKKRYNLATDTPDGDLVQPIIEKFDDGEYRFARYSSDGNALAIRTADIPNYHDFRGIRVNFTMENIGLNDGRMATMHNTEDPIDETHAVRDENNEIILDRFGKASYYPNFPDDFIFFGQDLSQIATVAIRPGTHTSYHGVPTTINESNRVYRASGFYGSNVDYGFHFNEAAMARQATLTAVDFSGYRDLYTANHRYGLEFDDVYPDQYIYYPPALDLPAQLLMFGTGEDVTRNLLVYAFKGDELTDEALEPFDYELETPEDEIFLHIIDTTSDEPGLPKVKPEIENFHLVDREDFNAPIAFDVTNTALYQRAPEVFSNGNDAWEGLCLPFTVKKVYATVGATSANPVRDHGELTHFYGTAECGFDEDQNGEADSHEYWLRKFTEVQSDASEIRIYFTRPASTEDLRVSNPADETEDDYFYSNDWFTRAYGAGYTEATSHARAAYTAEGMHYHNYPRITQRMPYIVSYPGRYFYEFDLSGWFYEQKYPGTVRTAQQLNYSHRVGVGEDPVTIPVTSLNPPVVITHDNHQFMGVFTKTKVDAFTAVIDEDSENNHSAFTRPQSTTVIVDPFRCYVRRPDNTAIPMRICSRNVDMPGDDDPDRELIDELNDIEIYLEDNDLIVVSPYDGLNLRLYDYGGRLIRILPVNSGENRFSDLSPNTYLLLKTKFRIN